MPWAVSGGQSAENEKSFKTETAGYPWLLCGLGLYCPLLTAHFVMLSRNLVYTAVTRARKLCVLVADPRALRLALGEVRKEERRTKLAERLRAAVDSA